MSPDGKSTPGRDPSIYEDDVRSEIVTPRDGELRLPDCGGEPRREACRQNGLC